MPTSKNISATDSILPRVLLAAPVSNKKDYILWEWLQHIVQFSYPNYDIYLVDNSPDESFQKWVWSQGFRCGYCPPQGMMAGAYVAKSQNMLRQHFLDGGYDYYFSLECDNFPPLNIIELMLSYKLDNFNIPYFLMQGANTCVGVQKSVINYQGRCINKLLAPSDGIAEFDGTVKPYYAPSFGCSMFSRKLMGQVKYRVEPNNPAAFSDSFFHLDSNKVGIQPYVHMGILCEHRRFTWKGNKDVVRVA